MRNITREQAKKYENTIIRVFIREALSRGYSLSVNTYGEDEITKSRQINKITAALRTTDYDYLKVYDGDKYIGHVFLVWGNEPYEVISDYSTSVENMVAPATVKAEEIETLLVN